MYTYKGEQGDSAAQLLLGRKHPWFSAVVGHAIDPDALLEEEAGEHGEAAGLFSRGAELEPEHAPLHNAHAAFAERRGDTDGARSIFRAACRPGACGQARSFVGPDLSRCSALLHGWGQFEQRAGYERRAAVLFERAVRRRSVDWPAEDRRGAEARGSPL